jgi:hypothetical protein
MLLFLPNLNGKELKYQNEDRIIQKKKKIDIDKISKNEKAQNRKFNHNRGVHHDPDRVERPFFIPDNKRKITKTDLTPDKIPYKVGHGPQTLIKPTDLYINLEDKS